MILFNETPRFQHIVTDDVKAEILENGYALPDDDLEISAKNSAILHFMNVETHVDGNGLSLLWLINGNGSFHMNGIEHKLKTGDVIAFDDSIEHAFSSDVICSAVNFTINDLGMNVEKIKKLIRQYNQEAM